MKTSHQQSNASQEKEAAHLRRSLEPKPHHALERTEYAPPAGLYRALADPCAAGPGDILALQRTVGNHAVSHLIQARLMVGDRYEQEVDRVAVQVLSGQPSARAAIQRQEEEELQTQSEAEKGFEVGSELESRLAAHKGGGSPLPGDVRALMEPRFGADFNGVRVHTGGEAAQLNRELTAQAFTHGQDIYLGAGKYDPGSDGGKRLLAHELTHVVQQSGAIVSRDIQERREPGMTRLQASNVIQRVITGEGIEVKQNGARVEAAFHFGGQERVLNTSIERHWWHAIEKAAKEKNSLLGADVSIADIERDIFELAVAYKQKMAKGFADFSHTAATSGRTYFVNKTHTKEPHGFPVSGPGVTPLESQEYSAVLEIRKMIFANYSSKQNAKTAVSAVGDGDLKEGWRKLKWKLGKNNLALKDKTIETVEKHLLGFVKK